MSSPILAVENIKMIKTKRLILDVPKLELGQGEVLSLVGHNGAGKSTLLQVLALLQKPTQGTVFFDGQPVHKSDMFAVRRQMAAVLQEALLLDTTVFKNAAVGLQLRKVPRKEIETRVTPWLERLGVAHLAKQSVRTLSGGEAQRVSLARALVIKPRVLFLDEPFSALDTPTREAILDDLHGILKESSMSAVFITHDYQEIPKLAHRVVELNKGQITQQGTPEKVLGYVS